MKKHKYHYLVIRTREWGVVPIETWKTYEAANDAAGRYNQEMVDRHLDDLFSFSVMQVSYYDE